MQMSLSVQKPISGIQLSTRLINVNGFFFVTGKCVAVGNLRF